MIHETTRSSLPCTLFRAPSHIVASVCTCTNTHMHTSIPHTLRRCHWALIGGSWGVTSVQAHATPSRILVKVGHISSTRAQPQPPTGLPQGWPICPASFFASTATLQALFCGSCKKGRAPGQGALAPDDPGIWLGASLVDHTHIERKRTRTCFAAVRWRQPIFETASERGAQGAALHVDPSPRPPFLPELYPALRSGPYSNVTCSWLQHDRANAAAPVVPVVRRRAAAQTTIAATTATA